MKKYLNQIILVGIFIISILFQFEILFINHSRLRFIFDHNVLAIITGFMVAVISITVTVICAYLFSDKPKEKNYIYTNHGKVEID